MGEFWQSYGLWLLGGGLLALHLLHRRGRTPAEPVPVRERAERSAGSTEEEGHETRA